MLQRISVAVWGGAMTPPHDRSTSLSRDEDAAVERRLMIRDIQEIRDDIAAMRAENAELLALFKGAKAVVSAVKWIGGFGAGLGAVWTAIAHFWPGALR